MPLLLAFALGQPPEIIPYMPHSANPNLQTLDMRGACPSGLTIEIDRYGPARPSSEGAAVRVNGRRMTGGEAVRLAADLSHADAVYRFHMSCDRDRRRAWLSIDIAKPAAEGEVSYFAASLFFGDRGILVYNRPRPVPAQSFWQWQTPAAQRSTSR